MGKPSNMPPPDKIVLYDRLIATHPDIERKGKNNPYTSVNGYMFTYLAKSGSLGIRLPKEEREAFLETYSTTLLEAYGSVMREFVAVPDNLLQDTEALRPYLDLSFAYTKSLKPKPTKKKKSS